MPESASHRRIHPQALSEFQLHLEESAVWVEALRSRLGWESVAKSHSALCAVLQVLRDHLPLEEAIQLGVQLPVLLRGEYFEGFHPRRDPLPLSDRGDFFMLVHEAIHRDPAIEPEMLARTVLSLVADRLPAAQRAQIEAASPAPLHGLWPD